MHLGLLFSEWHKLHGEWAIFQFFLLKAAQIITRMILFLHSKILMVPTFFHLFIIDSLSCCLYEDSYYYFDFQYFQFWFNFYYIPLLILLMHSPIKWFMFLFIHCHFLIMLFKIVYQFHLTILRHEWHHITFFLLNTH